MVRMGREEKVRIVYGLQEKVSTPLVLWKFVQVLIVTDKEELDEIY